MYLVSLAQHSAWLGAAERPEKPSYSKRTARPQPRYMPACGAENGASALSRRLDELGTPLDAAISLEVQEEELFQRLAARARADDTEQTIRNRLRVFAASNYPLLRYYEQRGLLARIDGVGDPDDLTELVVARLKDLMAHPITERRRSAEVALASMVGR